MKKLAIITSQLGASFVNKHVEDLAPGRTVAIARYGGHPLGGHWDPPCPVLYLDKWSLRANVRLSRRLGASEMALRDAEIARFLKRHGVGAVFGEFLDQCLDFVPLLEKLGLPFVVQGHGIDVSAELRKPEQRQRYLAYRSARAVLTRSQLHRQRLIELGLPAEKVHLNPGGVDVPAAAPVRSPAAAKRLLSLGRVAAKKGPIYMLEAFRLAAAQDPELTLDMVGDGPLFPAVQQFVDACGLSERVRLHRYVPDDEKARLLIDCGILIQHSVTDPDTGDEEGLPAATQEAMANGMAVVSTRHAGIIEAVVEGETGLLVDEGDVRGMADAILTATGHVAEWGAAGHRRALENYTWAAEKARIMPWIGDALGLCEAVAA